MASRPGLGLPEPRKSNCGGVFVFRTSLLGPGCEQPGKALSPVPRSGPRPAGHPGVEPSCHGFSRVAPDTWKGSGVAEQLNALGLEFYDDGMGGCIASTVGCGAKDRSNAGWNVQQLAASNL